VSLSRVVQPHPSQCQAVQRGGAAAPAADHRGAACDAQETGQASGGLVRGSIKQQTTITSIKR
jgi:hypothetical protein